jgi:hypothetical protein
LYNNGNYWYGYHRAWEKFLSEEIESYLILGCVDDNLAIALPHKWLQSRLQQFHITQQSPEKMYWHLHLRRIQAGQWRLVTTKDGSMPDVSGFVVNFN